MIVKIGDYVEPVPLVIGTRNATKPDALRIKVDCDLSRVFAQDLIDGGTWRIVESAQ